jgi:hypothetical protein
LLDPTADVIAQALDAGSEPANDASSAMAVIRRSRSITPVTLDRGAQPNVRLPGATHTPMGYTVGQRTTNVNWLS